MSGRVIDPFINIQLLQDAQNNNPVKEKPVKEQIDLNIPFSHPTLATASLIDRLNAFHNLRLSQIEQEEDRAEKRMSSMEWIITEMNRELRDAQNDNNDKDDNDFVFELSDEMIGAILYFQNHVWPEFQAKHPNNTVLNPFPEYVPITDIRASEVLDITKRLEMMMSSERRLLNKQGQAIKQLFEIDHLMSTLGAEFVKSLRKAMETIQRNSTPR